MFAVRPTCPLWSVTVVLLDWIVWNPFTISSWYTAMCVPMTVISSWPVIVPRLLLFIFLAFSLRVDSVFHLFLRWVISYREVLRCPKIIFCGSYNADLTFSVVWCALFASVKMSNINIYNIYIYIYFLPSFPPTPEWLVPVLQHYYYWETSEREKNSYVTH